MKQMFKFFVTAAAIAAGVTACTKEEVVPGGELQPQPALERATLTITVNNNGTTTRAVSDANATDAEKKIEKISLFIFGGNKTEAEKDTVFSSGATGFQEDGENVYKATLHDAPAGVKNIYVGINLPAALHDSIKKNGVGAAYSVAKTALKGFTYSTTNGFPMFSDDSKPAQFTIVRDSVNKFETSVKRLVAKVTAETTAAFENNTGNTRTVNGMTVDATLVFAVGQANTKLFPYPKKSGSLYEDPNYSAVIQGTPDSINYQNDFVNEFYDFKGNKDTWTSTTSNVFNEFKKVTVSSKASTITEFEPAYVLENTSRYNYEGELTYAFVKAKFTPAFTHAYDSIKQVVTPTANTSNTLSKLYVFNDNGVYHYLTKEDEAKAFKRDRAIDYTTYTDCTCFYMVSLNTEAQKFNVYRNDYYKLQIEKVNRLGDAFQGPANPTLPKGGKADLEVKITVQKWNLVTQQVTLD